MEQRQSLQQMVLKQLGIHYKKDKNVLDTDLHPSWKLNQKGSEFKYETQITKLLEDDRKENLDDLGNGDAFFDGNTKKIHERKKDTWSMKEIIDKMHFIKIKMSVLWKTI